MGRALTFLQGIYEAQHEEMERDERVVLMGQDLEANLYGASASFVGMFGKSRVRDLPISEAATVGIAAGAAMTGLRPVVDLTMSNFIYNAMDQLVNQVAKIRYMFGGQARLPVVYRTAMFYQGGNAAHHSDRPYPMLMNVPGLKIAVPSTGPDLKGLLKTAIRDDNPVICFEDANLWSSRGRADLDDADDNPEFMIPFGVGAVRRTGNDVTCVAIGSCLPKAMAAADALCGEGIDVEIIDPRTVVPMDWQLISASVQKTGRLVVVDPSNRTCGAAAEIAATVGERCFEFLRAPIRRVTSLDVHVPYAKGLEEMVYPSVERIVVAAKAVTA